MLADDIAPPRMVDELAPPEVECRVEVEGQPARFVSPVLEHGRARLEEFLGDARIEPFQPGQQDDRMTARPRDGHGIELEITEAVEDPQRVPSC
jgi:hypothetical protein